MLDLEVSARGSTGAPVDNAALLFANASVLRSPAVTSDTVAIGDSKAHCVRALSPSAHPLPLAIDHSPITSEVEEYKNSSEVWLKTKKQEHSSAACLFYCQEYFVGQSVLGQFPHRLENAQNWGYVN